MKFILNDYHRNISDTELLGDLQRVAKQLKQNSFTQAEYDKYGKYCYGTMHKRFGSWTKALRKADLEIKTNIGIIATGEELFKNVEEIWIKLGRQPKYSEVQKPLSKYHACTYERKYGGWRKALEKFVQYIKKEEVLSKIDLSNKPKINKTHKTPRTINLRIRFIVMKRDKFKCKKCGRSPATHRNVMLEVDHIIPYSKGGETIIENLQTLCSQCNQGRSDLY